MIECPEKLINMGERIQWRWIEKVVENGWMVRALPLKKWPLKREHEVLVQWSRKWGRTLHGWKWGQWGDLHWLVEISIKATRLDNFFLFMIRFMWLKFWDGHNQYIGPCYLYWLHVGNKYWILLISSALLGFLLLSFN